MIAYRHAGSSSFVLPMLPGFVGRLNAVNIGVEYAANYAKSVIVVLHRACPAMRLVLH